MKKKIARFLSQFFIIFYRLRYGKRIEFGKNIIVNHKLRLKGKGKLIIGEGTNLWAHSEKNEFHFYAKEAQIKIGENSRLNGVSCHSKTKITIGKNCLIASATLMDTDFHTFDDPQHVLFGNPLSKPIELKEAVWLGGQCVILKGVTLGERSVVGFRSIVTKSFGNDVVIAGNPAKIVKTKSKK